MGTLHYFENNEFYSMDSEQLMNHMKIIFLKNLLSDSAVRKNLKQYELIVNSNSYSVIIYQFAEFFLMYTASKGKDYQFEFASEDIEDVIKILADEDCDQSVLKNIRKYFTNK
jgi:uncharacterized protein (UPF0147 family)